MQTPFIVGAYSLMNIHDIPEDIVAAVIDSVKPLINEENPEIVQAKQQVVAGTNYMLLV